MGENKNYFSIHFLVAILLCLAVLSMIFATMNITNIEKSINTQISIENSRSKCLKLIDQFMAGSDYLTNKAYHYVFSGNPNYMFNYWYEVNEIRSRDEAVEALQNEDLTVDELAMIKVAMAESNDLVKGEYWAIRLVAESVGMSVSDMPVEIAEVDLDSRISLLSAEDKRNLAYGYILSKEYVDGKQKIVNTVDRLRISINENGEIASALATQVTKISKNSAYIFVCFIVLLLLITILCYYFYVIKPFRQYVKAIRSFTDFDQPVPLKPSGSKEMKAFAQLFNDMYWELYEKNRRLAVMSTIDYLTGIPNRASLDAYMQKLIVEKQTNMGVLLLDIDSFKSFNDTYGHMVGDLVLTELGKCLADLVPDTLGMAARLSGEEFVIAVPDTDEEKLAGLAERILKAVRAINGEKMGVPGMEKPVSVSIGGVIWDADEDVRTQDLLHKADMALYYAKKNGKNRYVAYCEHHDCLISLNKSQEDENNIGKDERSFRGKA